MIWNNLNTTYTIGSLKIEDNSKHLQHGKQVKRVYNKCIMLEQRICYPNHPQMKWIDYFDNVSYLN
jgi:hypothetical protein